LATFHKRLTKLGKPPLLLSFFVAIREYRYAYYIDENPARWTADHLNPDCADPDEIMKTIRDLELGTPPPVKPDRPETP
jgi:hypothetical protein